MKILYSSPLTWYFINFVGLLSKLIISICSKTYGTHSHINKILWDMTLCQLVHSYPPKQLLPLNTIWYLRRLEYFQHVISNFFCSTDCSQNKNAASFFKFEGKGFMLMLKWLQLECGSTQIAASAITKTQWSCWESDPSSQASLNNLHN
jgi:hypothetical protein